MDSSKIVFVLVFLVALLISSSYGVAGFDPYENCSTDNSSYQVKQDFEGGVDSPPTGWSDSTTAPEDWSSADLGKNSSRSFKVDSISELGIYPKPTGDVYTVSTWMRPGGTAGNLFGIYENAKDYVYFNNGADIDCYFNNVDQCGAVAYSAGAWYFVQIIVDNVSDVTSMRVWNESGSLIASEINGTPDGNANTHKIGAGSGIIVASYWDDFRIWSGRSCPAGAAPPAPGASNATTEQTVIIDRHTNVLVNSVSYQNIYEGSFSSNNTEAYLTYGINILPLGSNADVTCRVLVDNIDYDTERERSSLGNQQYGILYTLSSNFSLSQGSHNATLQCKKSSIGNFIVENAIGIIHLLKTSNNETIYASFGKENMLVPTVAGSKINETYLYNISNTNITGGKVVSVVVEGDLTYNYEDSNNIITSVDFGNQPCSIYARNFDSPGVGIGGTGSGGFFCTFNNATELTNISLNFSSWHTNTDAGDTVNISFVVKELVLNDGSVDTVLINTTQVDSTTFVNVSSLQINNSEFPSANLVIKAGFSAQSDSGSSDTEWQIMLNEVGRDDTHMHRDFLNENVLGLIVVQHVFESVGQGIINISLQGLCTNAACSVGNGSLIAYLTDSRAFLVNSTNVTIVNEWDNSSLSDFNVTTSSGTVFVSSNGTTEVFSSISVDNLTIQKDGYFSRTILNVTLGDDLNISIFASDIRFNASSIITFENLTGVNFTINGRTQDSFRITPGFYNVTAQKNGYWPLDLEINITPLLNASFNVTGMYNGIINITVEQFLTGTAVTDFNISTDYGLELQSNAEGFIRLPILQNISDRLINVSSSVGAGFSSITDFNISTSDYFINQIIYVFTFNSVLVNIYNAETLLLLNTTNVTMLTISSVDSFTNVTDTGFIFVDFLQPFDYELRFNATNFNTISKFITVINDSTQNISVYMTSNATSEIQVIEVLDTSNEVVEGAVVWLQKEVIGGPDQFITIQEAKTDFNGKTSVFVVRDTTVFYRFAVIVNGSARPILPNKGLFTGKTSFIPGVTETVQIIIDLEDVTTDFISDRLAISSTMFFAGADNNTVFFEWLDGRSTITGGKLVVKGRFLLNGSNYEVISSEIESGVFGSLNYTFIPINNTYYIIEGYVTFEGGREELVQTLVKAFTIDVVVDKDTGLLYAVFVLMVVSLITIGFRKTFGPAVGGVITISSLYVLVVFGIVNIPVGLITSLIAFIIIVFARIKSKNE